MQLQEKIWLTTQRLLLGTEGLYEIKVFKFLNNAKAGMFSVGLILLGFSWFSVFLGFWLTEFWSWKQVSISLAISFFLLLVAFYLYPTKDENLSFPKENLNKIQSLHLLKKATDDLTQLSSGVKKTAEDLVNPSIIVAKAIKNSPYLCILSACAFGYLIGQKEKPNGLPKHTI